MSRDRGSKGGMIYVSITPKFGAFTKALNDMAWHLRMIQGSRYWHAYDGRVRRTKGMKPLLHNGGKP